MTRDDRFISELETYLVEYEGSTPLPSSVRDAVRAQGSGVSPLTGSLPSLLAATVAARRARVL